ncbi:MAG: cysteine desulfurase [Clostridiales Family XIII bacterium]|jgi:cysteine desulfurase|nr:cysteine desulfurase [Clostridiales Family XIII bacterium]
MIVYLDNASTTKPCEAAIAASLDALTSVYGNPSSAHSMGEEAERVVKRARGAVADALGARPGNIVFTGSGTESDNLALYSVFKNPKRVAEGRVFISAVEHPAVKAPSARLGELGADVSVVPVDDRGVIDLGALEHSLEETLGCDGAGRILISVMHVNNELGTILPIADLARVKSRVAEKMGARIILHTDAIQSYLKLPIDVESNEGCGGFAGVDLLTFSAHKAHGPKGVGALYAAEPEKLAPLIRGGGQEGSVRSGTENVPGIAGFGAAASEYADDGTDASVEDEERVGSREAAERAASLRSLLLEGIRDAISDVRVNSPEDASATGEAGCCSPYVLNVSFLGTRGEVILHDLEQRGVFVSTGSACSNIGKGEKRTNPVLAAVGLTPDEAAGAIRLSLSRYNTEDEIYYAVEQLKAVVTRFRRVGVMR